MHIRGKTLDDLLRRVLENLLKSRRRISPTKGDAREIIGAVLELDQPRARLSRTEKKGTVFSCLGELLWYLSGTDDLSFIQHYIPTYGEFSDDGKTVWGAYGPRLFNMRGLNQINQVHDLLSNKRETRRAVIQLFNSEDIARHHEDVPCTCTMQFMIRNDHMYMFTSMRSNDAYLGLPHDVFAFTMLQEILARELSVGLGRYKHAVGSLHLYDRNIEDARVYLDEGWQSTIMMPPMPQGSPWPSIYKLIEAEVLIRAGRDVDICSLGVEEYWSDLARLLKIYSLTRSNAENRYSRLREVIRLKNEMDSSIYGQYISKREMLLNQATKYEQLSLIDQ